MSQTCQTECTYLKEVDGVVHVENVPCGREEFENGVCYLHMNTIDRSPKEIDNIVQAEIHDSESEVLNFSRIVFPANYTLELPDQIDLPISFELCRFDRPLSLTKRNFKGICTFRGATFRSSVDFTESQFLRPAYFSRFNKEDVEPLLIHEDTSQPSATFGVVSFDRCNFQQFTSFRNAHFQNSPSFVNTVFNSNLDFNYTLTLNNLYFRGTEFKEKTNLSVVPEPIRKIEGGEFVNPPVKRSIHFEDCDLKGVHLSTLPVESMNVHFSKIRNWKPLKKLSGAIETLDDVSFKNDSIRLQKLYSYLEDFHYKSKDFSLATAFYINLMRVRGKDKNNPLAARLFNRVYRLLSSYGTSVRKPIILLTLLWFVSPFILLQLGTPVEVMNYGQPNHRIIVKQYELNPAPNWFETKNFLRDYFAVIVANISFSTVDRRNALIPASGSWQQLLVIIESLMNVILATFLVIALRRQFNPKKPTGS